MTPVVIFLSVMPLSWLNRLAGNLSSARCSTCGEKYEEGYTVLSISGGRKEDLTILACINPNCPEGKKRSRKR